MPRGTSGELIVLSLTDGGGAWGYSAGFAHDGLDRFAGTTESGYQTTQVTCDAGGRRASLSSGFSAMTASTSYLYDAAGRLQTQSHDLAGPDFDQSTTFGYNPASQLTSEARTNGAYAFTRAANVARTYGVNGLNQYTGAGPAGAQSPFGYDANGNLTDTPTADGGTTHYTYDAENRLVQATTGASVVTLAYDPNGRLWQVSAPSGTTRFLYDGDRLIVESDGAGNALRSYTHGPGPDEPLVWYENGRKYLHADHEGSVVAVTDQDGNKLAINGYDAWGIPNSGNMGRFGYTGQAWLPELGMWYYKARIYSPSLGRFLQTDPIGYKDQVNLYAYVGNDPVDGRDPLGMESCPAGTTCPDIPRAPASVENAARAAAEGQSVSNGHAETGAQVMVDKNDGAKITEVRTGNAAGKPNPNNPMEFGFKRISRSDKYNLGADVHPHPQQGDRSARGTARGRRQRRYE